MGPNATERHVVIRRRGTKPPLFWVQPGLVQTAAIQNLDRDQPVHCLYRLKPDPGQPVLTFDQIAAYHIETIRSVCPQGPYALIGYCICGTIAYAMASQLRAQGENVSALIMIDPVDPIISRGKVAREPSLFRLRFHFNRVLFHLQRIRHYSTKDKLAYCSESLRAIKVRATTRRLSTAPGDTAAPDKLGDVHASDMYAFANCVPHPYAGSAVLLRPALAPPQSYQYPNCRWAQLITGGLNIQQVPGDSDSMWHASNARDMAQRIASCLPSAPQILV